MKRSIFSIILTLFFTLPALSQGATWQIDPDHSSFQFKVRHLMVSNVKGDFTKVKGAVTMDDKDVCNLNVDLTIEAASINTGHAKRDEHLRASDFFDVAKFAEATYEITGVNYTSDNSADINGTLTLKGASFPIKLTANIRGVDEKNFFAQAFFSLDRTTIGINFNGPAKDVQLAVPLLASK